MSARRRWSWAALAALASGGALPGCRNTPPGDPATLPAGQATRPTDPLATAPAAGPEFWRWAEGEVSRAQPPQPFHPDVRLPLARYPVVRLEDRLSHARLTSDWQAAPAGAEVLAELGPFSTAQQHPRLRVERRADSLAMSTWLTLRGVNVAMKDIGAIELELLTPYGEWVELIWSQAGRIVLPIPSPNEVHKYRVPADGLPEWEGQMRMIGLRVPATGPEPIEIRALRFLRKTAAFPQPVGHRRVSCGKAAQLALYAHGAATARFDNVALPADARFHASVARVASGDAENAGSGATEFELVIESDGQEAIAAAARVTAPSEWIDLAASLDSFSGKTVNVLLRSRAAEGGVACWGTPVFYQAITDPPVVVIYLIDTLAAEHIDLYGYHRPTMPRLRALAANGVWFANSFSNAARTIESIPNLLTALPVDQHGVHHVSIRLPQQFVTLPEVLRLAGFATVSFCTNVNAGPRQSLDQGFDQFFDYIATQWDEEHADRTVPLDATEAWLRARRDRPVFLYVHTAEPHAPYTPPPGFAKRFDPDYTGQYDGSLDKKFGFEQATDPRDIAHVVALYDEEVAYADHRLGLFLDQLTALGLGEKTRLLVTADHGEEFRQHGTWGHGGHLHNELTRVPLVVVGPEVAPRGRVDVPAQTLDLMPTVLAWLDLPEPYPLSGMSLMPLLGPGGPDGVAEAALRERVIVLANHQHRNRNVIEQALIAEGRWKLMYRFVDGNFVPSRVLPAGQRFGLYDLAADPRERENVRDSQPEVGRQLVARLLRWRATHAPFDFARGDDRLEIDLQQMRELEALGYINTGTPSTQPTPR